MDIPKTICQIIRKLQMKYSWMWWALGISFSIFYSLAFYLLFVSPTAFRWRAIYGDPDYPDGYEIHGIDISHYQGDVNWNRLRNAIIDTYPIRFVFLKATEGDSHLDAKFRENFFNSKEAGLIRGVYHFWSNQSSPRRQAYFFLAMAPLVPGDLPPVLDVETKPTDLSTEDFQQNILTWLHIVEDKYHVKPIIYTYYKFKDKYLSDSRFDDYPYWIAHYYVDKMEYQGAWKFWQHTDAGRLPGIKGYVDLNIYNGSYYDLIKMLIQKPMPVEVQDSTSDVPLFEDTVSD
ncbi:glycoside hydrolase family 25 protein [Prevotella brunnea]|uniref:Glycoside hydrolase family 25 protein n=2 Tax=Prevotellaceae TaxID=171552 RepID=A0A5C8GMG2_9BACT|nr:glycoside hydrolase family 25 protein [Prevotella brunnea]TXJ63382.1 glycoside hydrolase family 25 protein [Prevotella brunnea]